MGAQGGKTAKGAKGLGGAKAAAQEPRGKAAAAGGAAVAPTLPSSVPQRLLLDTHVWLWMLFDPARLGASATALLEDDETELVLSAATPWEIAIKVARGKLELHRADRTAATMVADWLDRGARALPITHSHAMRAAGLPDHHRDPFDRVLIAQAIEEGLGLMTADGQMAAYPELRVVPVG